jgi:CxxC motif-containing protein
MEKRELVCIGCPMGCMLNVEMEQGEVTKVTGHTCPKGEKYAYKEVTNPTRIVTSTVRVNNGKLPVVSVKTSCDIPKEKINSCMEAIQGIVVTAPVYIGDIVLKEFAGIRCDIVATKNVEKK